MEQVVDKKIDLDLVGIDGNAYVIMATFQRQARKEKWTPDEIKSVLDECKTGDYDHLLQTIIAHIE